MIFPNRRVRLLFVALAGMEATVLIPFLLLLFRLEWLWREAEMLRLVSPVSLLLSVWLGLAGAMAVVDFVGRSRLSDQRYRLTVAGLVLLTGLLAVRLFVYPGAGLFDLGWLAATAGAVINFHQGLYPATFTLLLVLFLWLRASVTSGRLLTFFSVSGSFRWGGLLLLAGGGTLAVRSPVQAPAATLAAVLFVMLSLLALSLARSDEKAEGAANSTGAALPWDRLGQLLLAVTATVGLGLALAGFFSPQRVRAMLAFFNPLWGLLGELLSLVLLALSWVVEQLVHWLFALLRLLFVDAELPEIPDNPVAPFVMPELAERAGLEGAPGSESLLFLLRAGFTVVVLALFVGVIYVLLVRRRVRPQAEDGEDAQAEGLGAGGDALRRGWQRLRNLADLVRRYGLGRDLLDAISVENLYANLSRLARERGQPRLASQPPDDYLPLLALAFPGQQDGLARITEAYMRVYYGEQRISGEELESLRTVYEQIRTTEKQATDEHR